MTYRDRSTDGVSHRLRHDAHPACRCGARPHALHDMGWLRRAHVAGRRRTGPTPGCCWPTASSHQQVHGLRRRAWCDLSSVGGRRRRVRPPGQPPATRPLVRQHQGRHLRRRLGQLLQRGLSLGRSSMAVSADDSLRLRYRVVVHDGAWDAPSPRRHGRTATCTVDDGRQSVRRRHGRDDRRLVRPVVRRRRRACSGTHPGSFGGVHRRPVGAPRARSRPGTPPVCCVATRRATGTAAGDGDRRAARVAVRPDGRGVARHLCPLRRMARAARQTPSNGTTTTRTGGSSSARRWLVILRDFEARLPGDHGRAHRSLAAAVRRGRAGRPRRGLVHEHRADEGGARGRGRTSARTSRRGWTVVTRLAESVVERRERKGAFDEFNSPTYYGIDLLGLALWRTCAVSSRLREWGAAMETRAVGRDGVALPRRSRQPVRSVHPQLRDGPASLRRRHLAVALAGGRSRGRATAGSSTGRRSTMATICASVRWWRCSAARSPTRSAPGSSAFRGRVGSSGW